MGWKSIHSMRICSIEKREWQGKISGKRMWRKKWKQLEGGDSSPNQSFTEWPVAYDLQRTSRFKSSQATIFILTMRLCS